MPYTLKLDVMAVSQLYQRGVLMLFLSLFFVPSFGQSLTNYSFVPTSGTYTAITGTQIVSGGIAGGVNDEVYANLPIGFDFWYMGQMYSRFSVSSNGWLTLGAVIGGSAPTNNLASGGTRPVIAPLWDDLAIYPGLILEGLLPGNMSYISTGTVGSRVLTMQWDLMRWDRNSAVLLPTVVITFQAKLYENGNVQFVYKREGGAINNGSASIGITSATGTFLSLSSSGVNPSANFSTETNNISSKPANGQTYTFDPAELAAPSALNFSRVGATGMRLNWTDNSSGEAGFVIYRSTDGGTTYAFLHTTAANAAFYDDTNLTNGNTYHYRVYTLRENLSATFASGSQAANCNSFAWGSSPNASGAGNNGPVCAGFPLTLSSNAVDGATYSWVGPNGFTSNVPNPEISSYSDAAKGTYTVTITMNGCTITASTVVISKGQGQWTGRSNSNWSNPINWCDGILPTGSVDVVIPSAEVTNEPNLATIGSARNMNVQSGRTLTIANGGNLQISGVITRVGTIITTAGKVTFNGTAAQSIPANVFSTNTIADLELNNSAGVTLNGALRLTGLLTASSGVFNANGFLTLASTLSSTAQVAQIPSTGASIQGQVRVERFVSGGVKDLYRGYRMLSSPVYDNTTEFRNADVQGNRSAQFNQLIDDVIITGPGGAANGFDPSHNNAAGAWTHNLAYVGIPNISTAVNAGRGMYLFFRGNRDNITSKTNSPYVDPENVVVDFEGVLNQQDVTVSLNYSATLGGFNLLGNPYAATIDWDSPNWATDKVNINNSIWIWNPAKKSYATYINGVGTLDGSRYIASGQSFFVRTSAPGAIKFKESIKAASKQPPTLLMSVPAKRTDVVHEKSPMENPQGRSIFRMVMKPLESFGEDETVIAFKEGSSLEYTEEDALHLNGEVVNLSTVAGTRRLAINFLPPFARSTDIALSVNAAATGAYSLSFNLDEYFQGHSLILKDQLLQQTIPITAGGVYNFNIDKTKAETFGDNRFSIAVNPPEVLPVEMLTFEAKKQTSGVLVSWATSIEVNHQAFKLYRAGDDGNFVLLNDFLPEEGGRYVYLDATPLTGPNYYKLVQVDLDGTSTEIKLVSVNFSVGDLRAVNVYPNPVREKFTIKVDAVLSDRHQLSLYDFTGRVLKTHEVSKTELMNGHEVDVLALARGVYFLKLEEVGTRKIVVVHKVVKH